MVESLWATTNVVLSLASLPTASCICLSETVSSAEVASSKISTLGFLINALALSGVFLLGFGAFEKVLPMTVFGFLFFATLPFANNCLDYLSRINIPDAFQGRAWGLIGFISQLGYVIAYSVSGAVADYIGILIKQGVGKGSAMIIGFSGICLIAISVCIPMIKRIRELEG